MSERGQQVERLPLRPEQFDLITIRAHETTNKPVSAEFWTASIDLPPGSANSTHSPNKTVHLQASPANQKIQTDQALKHLPRDLSRARVGVVRKKGVVEGRMARYGLLQRSPALTLPRPSPNAMLRCASTYMQRDSCICPRLSRNPARS